MSARATTDPDRPDGRRSGPRVADSLQQLNGRFLWMHCDTQRDGALLLTLSEALLQKDPDLFVLLSLPGDIAREVQQLARRIVVPSDSDGSALVSALLSQKLRPEALLLAVQVLPISVLRVFFRSKVPIFVIDSDGPVFPSVWQHIPGYTRSVLAQLAQVFLQSPSAESAWLARGLPPSALTLCGKLAATPTAFGCNEAEREALALALRLRPVWLAAAVPEREEHMILAAQREALRESHRLALILHPADRTRGTALKAMFGAEFQTALRSEDDLLTPDTQVYIVDTEAERGLWYRLAVACYLGGSLTSDGATITPLEPAGMGCALVHGRFFGRHGDAFDLLRGARATRMIQSPEALGAAICTALRPEQAADQAHRGWQVISEGYEATETVLAALLQAVQGQRQP